MSLILLLLLLLAIMLFMGVPVAIALALSAASLLWALDIPLVVAVQRMASGLNVFALMAIPLFVLSGELMNKAGIAQRLLKLADSALARAPGGLGQVSILASMLFGAVSGSAVASASAMGSALGPEMRAKGYDPAYAVNVTITSSITGLLIPPSHNMIIYATAAGAGISVGELFIAGVVPGVMTGLVLMLVAGVIALRRGYPRGQFPGVGAFLVALVTALPGMLTAVIVVAGILLGVFTPTESAAVACAYTLMVGLVVYRSLSRKALWEALRASLRTTALVMFVIAAASLFGWVLAVLEAPARLAAVMAPFADNPLLTILLINIILLLLGTFMDMAPLILITTPIFLPIAQSVGMDPIQFGVMLMLNLGIGLVTPPVGSVLFVGCAVQNLRVGQVLGHLWPFYLALIVSLLLVSYIPAVTLLLPALLR